MISRATPSHNIDYIAHNAYGRRHDFRGSRRLGTRGLIVGMCLIAMVFFISLELGAFDWIFYELF